MADALTTNGNVIPFPIRAHYLALPAGDAGVKITIARMIDYALGSEGARNPEVRAWALAAVANAPDRDDEAQASAIYEAVKRSVRFRGEYSETVQTPLVTLQLGAGDCDDHATLLAGLLRSIGIPARFETVATDDSRQFSHVFALAGIRKGGRIVSWMPLDTTVPAAYPGWKPAMVTREKIWNSLSGLGVIQPGAPDVSVSQKVSNAAALIDTGTNSALKIIDAVRAGRNTASSADFNVGSGPGGGVSGSMGISPNMLIVGGLGAVGLLALALRRGK